MAEEISVLPAPHGSDLARVCHPVAESLRQHAVGQGTLARPASLLERLFRSKVHALLGDLQAGELVLHEGKESVRVGKPCADHLTAHIQVHSPTFYRRVALGGTIGAAESYMDGEWDASNLTHVIQLMIRNGQLLGSLEGVANWIFQPLLRSWHAWRDNSQRGSKRNIAAHYDLGNDFFASFLDSSMAYSSGVYTSPVTTLAEAQAAKFERLCQKLSLKPSDHLVEIGCGWGGLAIHAAKKYGCRVTGITISKEQFALATERVKEAGLSDRIEILLTDYRQLTGQYDKLVSVEMIEAVGHKHLGEYFGICSRLLKPSGVMALQGITIADRLYASYCRGVDFIQRYIFPGGHLPCTQAIMNSVASSTDLTLAHQENLPQHYARTLSDWNELFQAARPQLRKMNLPEEFLRMWEFYFCYCEAGFREEQLGLVQMVFTKPQGRVNPVGLVA
ncbi:MAG: class I SAM-dependent methyltransferase [Planctomycetaceae bacterium]